MSKNKRLTLQPGFLVDNWDGEIKKIHYTTVSTNVYGSQDDKYLILDSGGNYSIESKYSTYIESTLDGANNISKDIKVKRIKDYGKQIKECQEKLKELKNE